MVAGAILSLHPLRAADEPVPASQPPISVAVPLEMRRGLVIVPTTVNGSEPLFFMLDTGFGISTIHPELLEPLGLRRAGRLRIIGIAGEERAGTYAGAVFDFDGATFAPPRIASIPSDAERSRRRRDGVLGVGFFRRFTVEIDPHTKTVRLHEPASFEYAGPGEIIPLHFEEDTPIIDAAIIGPEGKTVQGRFEIDTGCDDALCLGSTFTESNQLLPWNGATADTKRGVGGSARIEHGALPELRLGRLVVAKPSTSFFTDGSPADDGLAGHIGMAALHGFKVIFDYRRRRMILEPLGE